MGYHFGGVNFWLLLLAMSTYSLVPPRIRNMKITSDIRYRFATTHITFDVSNTQPHTEDFYFETQLPMGSLISNVSLYVNGTLYVSKTQQISEDYKIWLQKTNLKMKPIKEDKLLYFDTNIFLMTVSMAGLSNGQFNLTYNYLLHRQSYTYRFPVYIFFRQGQFVEDVEINTYLWEPRKIGNLSASLFKERNMPIVGTGQQVKFDPLIRLLSSNKVHISYKTSLGNIRNIFTRNFLLKYSLKEDQNSKGDVLWHNDHGLYFFAPQLSNALPKDIVFAIDYTDSMSGKKLSDVQRALSRMLRMTAPVDRFNVILYNNAVFRWRDSLQPVNPNNIQNAIDFLKTVPSRQLTNFTLAIEESLSQLSRSRPSNNRPRVVYFLSDGWHSVEHMQIHKISKYFRKANKYINAIFFTVALYAKADYVLLKTLSNLSGGKLLKIIEAQNISDSMVNFYMTINTPLLTNISMVGPSQNTYNYVGIKEYYIGSENILYFNKSNIDPIDSHTFSVSALGANGSVSFENIIENSHIEDNIGGLSSFQRKNFMTSYLDFLFIRTVFDRKLKKLEKEAIDRAKKSGFLTPWTYLSAIPIPYNNIQNLVTEKTILDEEIEIPGRGFTGSGVGDPHFTIRIRGLKRPVCFDLSGHDGDFINLLADDTENLYINAKIIKASNNSRKTYLGEISIVKPNKMWLITPNEVKRKTSEELQWKDIDKINKTNGTKRINSVDQINQINNKSIHDISFRYSGYRTLTVTTNSKRGKIEFLFRRTETKHQPIKIEYLNFYLTDSTGLSRSTHGLMGQFINWKGNITKLHMQPKGKIQSWIKLESQGENRTFKAVLTHNRRSLFSHQECWTVWKEGKCFINGKYEDYLTHGLNSTSSSQR